MSAPHLIGAASVVVAAAALAGFAPQRLLAPSRAVPPSGPPGRGLTLWAAAIGLATLLASNALLPGNTALALGLALLATALAAMAAVDLEHLIIPDLHVAMIAGLALVGPLAPPLTQALMGAGVGGGLLWLVRFGYRRMRGQDGLGFGDVKLLAAIGGLTGPRDVLWVVVGGAVIGIVLLLLRGRDWEGAAPLGTAVAAPALAAALLARWPS